MEKSQLIAFESIKNIEDKLIEGNDFASIANEFSEDVVTKDIGGDLEWNGNKSKVVDVQKVGDVVLHKICGRHHG